MNKTIEGTDVLESPFKQKFSFGQSSERGIEEEFSKKSVGSSSFSWTIKKTADEPSHWNVKQASGIEADLAPGTTEVGRHLSIDVIGVAGAGIASTFDLELKSVSLPLLNISKDNYRIMEDEVRDLLKENSSLFSRLLDNYINAIREYFEDKRKNYKLGVTLRRDPEDPDFWAVLIVINSPYEDFDERLKLISEVGKILDEETEILSRRLGDEVSNMSASITFTLGKK